MADAKFTISAVDNTKAAINSATSNITALSTGFLATTKAAELMGTAVKKTAEVIVDLTKNGINASDELKRFTTLLGSEHDAKSLLGAMDKLDDITLATKDNLSSFSQELITMGKSQQEIQTILAATVNLSNTSGRSFTEVQSAMQRAMTGSTTAIERMMPELKELSKDAFNNGDAFKYMNEKLGEASVTIASGSFSQKLDAISTSWTRIKETIGGTIVANIEASGILDKMYTALLGIETAVSNGAAASKAERIFNKYGTSLGEMTDVVAQAGKKGEIALSLSNSPYADTPDIAATAGLIMDQNPSGSELFNVAANVVSAYNDNRYDDMIRYWGYVLDMTGDTSTVMQSVYSRSANAKRDAFNSVANKVNWNDFSSSEIWGLARADGNESISPYLAELAMDRYTAEQREGTLSGKYSTYAYKQDTTLLGSPTSWGLNGTIDSAFSSGYARYLEGVEAASEAASEAISKAYENNLTSQRAGSLTGRYTSYTNSYGFGSPASMALSGTLDSAYSNGYASYLTGIDSAYEANLASQRAGTLNGRYTSYTGNYGLGTPTSWGLTGTIDSAYSNGLASYLTAIDISKAKDEADEKAKEAAEEAKRKKEEEDSAKLHAQAMSKVLSADNFPELAEAITQAQEMSTEETVQAITAGTNIMTSAINAMSNMIGVWSDGYDYGDAGSTISSLGSIVSAFNPTWGAAIQAAGGLVSAGENLVGVAEGDETSTSSVASIQSATYNGATTIRINNYFDGAYIVGSGGMTELAKIISDEMDSQAYTRTNS